MKTKKRRLRRFFLLSVFGVKLELDFVLGSWLSLEEHRPVAFAVVLHVDVGGEDGLGLRLAALVDDAAEGAEVKA